MAETNLNADYETHTAAADLSANIYNAVAFVALGRVAVASGNLGHTYAGILANAPAAAGRAASVVTQGRFKAVAGAAVASIGVPLTYNTSGRVIVAASASVVIGKALEAASADGDIISVDLNKPWRLGGAY